jgi:hypothetical protein
MSHYAKVVDGLVEKVIVCESDFFDDFIDSSAGSWVQTSYNTVGGVHLNGGTPLRKNYGGVGFTYDLTRDAFIAPQPYPSWILDESTCQWEAPVAYPDDDTNYHWNEETKSWDLIEG